MTPTEQWRPVAGVAGYEVSSLGNVRSYLNTRGRIQATSHPIKPCPIKSGHLTFGYRIAGQKFRPLIHRLVLEAFVGPCPDGMEVRHLDGDPTNNTLTNLRYGTRSENNKDRVRHGTHNNAKKTHCKWGHAFTPDNIYSYGGRNVRVCKTCHRRRELAAKQKMLAGAA